MNLTHSLLAVAAFLLLTLHSLSKRIWHFGRYLPHTDARLAILVTGAAGGVGNATVSQLLKSRKSVFVYACDINEDELHRLYENENRVRCFKMDVTSNESVCAVADLIAKEEKKHYNDSNPPKSSENPSSSSSSSSETDSASSSQSHRPSSAPLFAIVNCAGVAQRKIAALTETTDDVIREIFEVNVFGMMRVTRAFWPHLIEPVPAEVPNAIRSRRVVNISSVAGRYTPPYLSIYSMSKHSVEAFCDGLRRETRLSPVRVVCVQPGMIKTRIWNMSPTARVDIGQHDYHKILKRKQFIDSYILERMTEPTVVARTVEESLFAIHPRTRYIVAGSRLERLFWAFLFWMPDRIVDWITSLIDQIVASI